MLYLYLWTFYDRHRKLINLIRQRHSFKGSKYESILNTYTYKARNILRNIMYVWSKYPDMLVIKIVIKHKT